MALTEENKKIFIERIKVLPDELRSLLFEGEFDLFFETMAREYNLTDVQKSKLSDELLFILLAFESLEKLPKNLVSNVGVSQTIAKNILRKLIASSLEQLVLFSIQVYAQTDKKTGRLLELIFGNGRKKSQQDYINEEIVKKYSIPETKVPMYIEIVENVVLGFNKISDLPRLLQQNVGLDKETAQKLVAELIDAWGLIVEREENEERARKQEVSSLADKIEAIKPVEPTSELKPAEETPTTPVTQTVSPTEPVVKPIRTMDADMQKVHGYGALAENLNAQTEDEPVIKATSQDEIKPLGT